VVSYPKISIVTPSFNDAPYLERAILSVLSQNYPNLEYIIIDGGSTDGSVDIIQKYQKRLAYWVTEKDNGMYDAINKGFQISTGEIMGWINSDDRHQPGSLYTLAQVFSDYLEVNWVQGWPTVVDELDRIFVHPHRHQIDRFFFYSKAYVKSRVFIQQESTFWRRNLWLKTGGKMSTDYKYAGDFDLWMRFFQYEEIYHLNAVIGSFRQSRGLQASKDNFEEYLNETFRIVESISLPDSERRRLRRLLWIDGIQRYTNRLYSIFMRKLRIKRVASPLYFDSALQRLRKP
jgi:glycosyltransferase involved in cell wall biosynthesis